MATAKPAVQQPTPESVGSIVDTWISKKLANSEFSANTPAWNRLQEVKKDLVDELTAHLTTTQGA